MRFPLKNFLAWTAVVLIAGTAVRAAEVQLPSRDKLQVYLLMGQSNMAGRGKPDGQEQSADSRILVFDKDGKWAPAKDPLHWDKPKIAGIGLGITFAKTVADAHPDVTVGLVPCAVGGTPLKRWEKGGDLYAAALERAKQASEQGTLAGILWHQGESDSNPADAGTYLQRFTKMVRDFRADLGMEKLPVVMGELGEFHVEKAGATAAQVNEALDEAAAQLPNAACVSSAGLTDGGDHLHFDARSLREFGKRFGEAMLRLRR